MSRGLQRGDCEAAHALFTERLAPRWWAAGQHARLRSQLQPLLQAGQEAQAQVDSLQWQTGAELYATFFALEVRRQQELCRAGFGNISFCSAFCSEVLI